MVMNAPAAGTTATATESGSASRYTGEVVYVFAYDLAYELSRDPIPTLLGQPVAQFAVDASKRSPRHLLFFRPQMIRLPPLERIGPHGPMQVRRTVKLMPVGAISITVHVSCAVNHFEQLVDYHDLQFNNGSLQDEVRDLAEQIRTELMPHLVRPVGRMADEEAYTVFCLAAPFRDHGGNVVSTESWMHSHRRQVASVLTQETDPSYLSRQEADESTDRYLSYYQHDLAVVDWDAALIVDDPSHFEETLYILELANVQLAELEAYDRILDDALERAYRDLVTTHGRRRSEVLRELREIRVDLARLSDELSNITKFFGDWHLARIYSTVAARFHLADWHRAIDRKLETLDNLYEILEHDRNNRWMLVLEITIVFLFMIDLALLLLGHR
jgi:hypothetical protein